MKTFFPLVYVKNKEFLLKKQYNSIVFYKSFQIQEKTNKNPFFKAKIPS